MTTSLAGKRLACAVAWTVMALGGCASFSEQAPRLSRLRASIAPSTTRLPLRICASVGGVLQAEGAVYKPPVSYFGAGLRDAVRAGLESHGALVVLAEPCAAGSGRSDLRLEVEVRPVAITVEVFGRGYIVDMTTVWHLYNDNGRKLLGATVSGQGVSREANALAYRAATEGAVQAVVGRGVGEVSRFVESLGADPGKVAEMRALPREGRDPELLAPRDPWSQTDPPPGYGALSVNPPSSPWIEHDLHRISPLVGAMASEAGDFTFRHWPNIPAVSRMAPAPGVLVLERSSLPPVRAQDEIELDGFVAVGVDPAQERPSWTDIRGQLLRALGEVSPGTPAAGERKAWKVTLAVVRDERRSVPTYYSTKEGRLSFRTWSALAVEAAVVERDSGRPWGRMEFQVVRESQGRAASCPCAVIPNLLTYRRREGLWTISNQSCREDRSFEISMPWRGTPTPPWEDCVRAQSTTDHQEAWPTLARLIAEVLARPPQPAPVPEEAASPQE